MSPNPEDEYFADGMTEEIILTLSRIPEIQVIARTSVMTYKKNPKPVKEISRELDVGTVLEGSVRKAGNKFRITIQMVDTSMDRNLWADSYDRELQDMFAVQTEVATRVAQALAIKPLFGSRASLRKNPTGNTEAYALYLKGRYHWNKRGPENLKTALEFFERAVIEDPNFALACTGMADSYEILSNSWLIDSKTNHEKAKKMVVRALKLDPELAEAHAAYGLTLLSEFRFGESEDEFRKALAFNPSYAPAHLWYYHLLRTELRWNEAQAEIEKAVMLDPLSANMIMNQGSYHYAMGDYRAALELGKKSVTLDPSSGMARFSLANTYGKIKMLDEAKHELQIAANILEKSYPHVANMTGAWYGYLEGDKEKVRKLLPEIERNVEKSFSSVLSIATLCFFLDDYDKGFDWLDRAYASKEYQLTGIQSWGDFPAAVRDDPRYLKLLKKMGLLSN